jgi:hypothetical protein
MEGPRTAAREALEVPFNRTKSAFIAAFGIGLLAGLGWLVGALAGNPILSAVVGSLGLVLGLFLSLDYLLVAIAGARLVIDPTGVEVRLPLGRRLAVPWEDVARVGWRTPAAAPVGTPGSAAATIDAAARTRASTSTIAIDLRPGWRAAGNQVPLSIFFAGSRGDTLNLNPLVLAEPAGDVIEVMERARRGAMR